MFSSKKIEFPILAYFAYLLAVFGPVRLSFSILRQWFIASTPAAGGNRIKVVVADLLGHFRSPFSRLLGRGLSSELPFPLSKMEWEPDLGGRGGRLAGGLFIAARLLGLFRSPFSRLLGGVLPLELPLPLFRPLPALAVLQYQYHPNPNHNFKHNSDLIDDPCRDT